MTIRACRPTDVPAIYEIINDAAQAYKGVIPADCWHEPYMPMGELDDQIRAGVRFSGYAEQDRLLGIMGIQDRGDVDLIRHAYVRTAERNRGIGGKLLEHLQAASRKPILIGTWAAATWAIAFYRSHGFRLLPAKEAAPLMQKYWRIPERQVETSVVLAAPSWKGG